ncbi:zinc metalloproteinase nas-15-like [Hydractinia symbiolongicarpus]|uniref:zinc metalloproteinase nas-15-like n=1 Tax=Hydractinia symbiolongicarpus TaxID=13093 RepID=UPI00254DBF0F|nr:zinc metalloproteinase nas-15-like [Hydractinia symbiolongicarpus]
MEDPNLFEGDMILSPDQLDNIQNGRINKAIPMAAAKTNLWPRIIPFDYKELESTPGRVAIDKAIKEIEQHTCLRFVKRTTERGYLKFINRFKCATFVGYSPMMIKVSFGSLCWEPGIAVHEILHALGFYHEQSRPDRDNFVKINYENVLQGSAIQFKKYGTDKINSLGIPYDYQSIMHYGEKAFSKNRKNTIETLDPKKQSLIGQRKGLSKLDIQQINLLYKCNEKLNTSTLPRTKASTCTDRTPDCSLFKQKCQLKKDPLHKWTVRYCKKTCGLCAKVSTLAKQNVQVESRYEYQQVCKDELVNCDAFSHKCKSSESSWKSFVKNQCAKTCGYCSMAVKTTVPAPVTTANPYCYDKVNCKDYVANGYCSPKSPSFFHQYMKKNCIKSCGWCVTVLPPIGTPPPWPKDCGVPTYQTSKVIGGVDAKRGAWPWQARLYKTNTYASYCGASLISTTWLVTAAHCVSGKSAKDITVHLGLHNLAKAENSIQEILVRQIIVHPSYNKPTRMNNDIALLQLVKPAILNDRVKAVCLPKQGKAVKLGTKCYLTGWGKTKHPGGPSLVLQQTDLDIVDSSICHALNYGNYRIPVTKGMVCAGLGHNTIQSGCHGDSGGPLVCKENNKFVLHGDVSWGSHICDASKGYTVFGRVSHYRTWMDQYIYT